MNRTWFVVCGVMASSLVSGCRDQAAEGPVEEAPVETGEPEAPVQAPAVSLASGFTVVNLTGESGGELPAADRFGEACRGNLTQQPSHVIDVVDAVTVTFAVTSDADTTLVVSGQGEPRCNDDFDGLNPGLRAELASGRYEVFVGNFSLEEGPTPYTLSILPVVTQVPSEPEGTGTLP